MRALLFSFAVLGVHALPVAAQDRHLNVTAGREVVVATPWTATGSGLNCRAGPIDFQLTQRPTRGTVTTRRTTTIARRTSSAAFGDGGCDGQRLPALQIVYRAGRVRGTDSFAYDVYLGTSRRLTRRQVTVTIR